MSISYISIFFFLFQQGDETLCLPPENKFLNSSNALVYKELDYGMPQINEVIHMCIQSLICPIFIKPGGKTWKNKML